jgi:hypothetical protein
VGSYRYKNNLAILQEIANEVDSEVEFVVVGPDTGLLTQTTSITTHGNLEQKERKVISQEAESMGKRSHPDQAKKHLQ